VRIASLVPSATETLFALGAGRDVVGVTHECDYPPEAVELPHLTRSVVPEGMSSGEIDRAVRDRTERGEAIYELDVETLRAAEPDLIVTQALCAVCAVSFEDVRAIAEELASPPELLSLDPTTIGEVLADTGRVADAVGREEAGTELVALAADRIDAVTAAVEGARRPRVAALEWLDPPFAAGHWVPQMIELAGGEDVLGLPGERSKQVTWDEVAASQPDVVVSMPCGYYAERCAQEVALHHERVAFLGAGEVVAVDAASCFSRPGPRLVDGLELLAHVLHPDRVPEPATGPDGPRAIGIDMDALAGATR